MAILTTIVINSVTCLVKSDFCSGKTEVKYHYIKTLSAFGVGHLFVIFGLSSFRYKAQKAKLGAFILAHPLHLCTILKAILSIHPLYMELLILYFREWGGIASNFEKYLVHVRPPGDSMTGLIRNIISEHNISNAAIIFDFNYGQY